MKTKKTFIALALALASAFMLPAARATEHDQASKLTFNQSVQIPGRVLPPGLTGCPGGQCTPRNPGIQL